MSISIQNSNPALATLEALALQQAGATNAGTASASAASAAAVNASAANPADSLSAILDLSGGASAASSLNGMSGILGSASAADIAVAAGNQVESLLAQMRQDALTAANPTTTADARAALNKGFQSDVAAISAAVSNASFNGVNLIDGSTASAGANGAALTGVDLTPTGPLIGLSAGASLSDPATAASIANQLGAAIDNVGQALGQVAAQGQAIGAHLSVVAQAGLALQPSLVGQITPNLSAEGASLAALQVQQQLSSSAGAIASQTPQAILALFR